MLALIVLWPDGMKGFCPRDDVSQIATKPQALLLSGGEQQRLAMARVLLRHLGSFRVLGG